MRRSPLAVTCAATLACGNSGARTAADVVRPGAGEAVDVVLDCPPPTRRGAGGVTLVTDLTYVTVGGRPLRLDLARPASVASTLCWC